MVKNVVFKHGFLLVLVLALRCRHIPIIWYVSPSAAAVVMYLLEVWDELVPFCLASRTITYAWRASYGHDNIGNAKPFASLRYHQVPSVDRVSFFQI